MGLCGCFPECACQLNVEPPELLSISGNGDPASGGWTLTANETVFALDSQLGGITVTPGGSYGHNPNIELDLDNSGNVQFSVSPADGLRGDVVMIPPSAGGVPPGVSFSYHGSSAPAGYLLEYGQLVNIADYPDLFAAIGHVGNGGVDPGGGQFRIPDGRGLFDVGRDNMGGVAAGRVTGALTLGAIGGNQSAQLGVTNLPAHTHTETGSHSHPLPDLNHAHSAGASPVGDHTHTLLKTTGGGGAITNGAQLLLGSAINNGAPSTPTAPYIYVTATNVDGLSNTTSAAGGHNHTITVNNSVGLSGLSTNQNSDLVTVGGGGSGAAQGAAFLILPPYRVVNKIIKT